LERIYKAAYSDIYPQDIDIKEVVDKKEENYTN
jgi:hypothetical protein